MKIVWIGCISDHFLYFKISQQMAWHLYELVAFSDDSCILKYHDIYYILILINFDASIVKFNSNNSNNVTTVIMSLLSIYYNMQQWYFFGRSLGERVLESPRVLHEGLHLLILLIGQNFAFWNSKMFSLCKVKPSFLSALVGSGCQDNQTQR
jgi:hypothetical protein